MEREDLLAAARAAAEHAYAPYSRFRVGAAAVTETSEGELVATGANVENASYSLTICAERVALASLFQLLPPSGETPRITQVAIACVDAPEDAPDDARVPCGACRQWLAELAPEATYYVDGIARDLTLPDLLPLAFQLERSVERSVERSAEPNAVRKPRARRTRSQAELDSSRARQSATSSKSV
jgi:cytidine deaminase